MKWINIIYGFLFLASIMILVIRTRHNVLLSSLRTSVEDKLRRLKHNGKVRQLAFGVLGGRTKGIKRSCAIWRMVHGVGVECPIVTHKIVVGIHMSLRHYK